LLAAVRFATAIPFAAVGETELPSAFRSSIVDVRALVPSEGSDLLLHLGDTDFLDRWHNYQQHLEEWKAQYPRLASIDLRYERQVVLEMQKGAPASARSSPSVRVRGYANDAGKPIGWQRPQ
jgi:hypothetical protein